MDRIERLETALKHAIETIECADTSEGICCCGEMMKTHDNGMHSGHAPVDAGNYAAFNVIEECKAALNEK